MRWEGNRESDNVEDRRDDGDDGGGGGGGFGFGGRSIGIGTIVVALVGGWIFGINPLTILGLLSGAAPPAQGHQDQQDTPALPPPAAKRITNSFSTVLDATVYVRENTVSQGGASY